jgi:hypothetical protein
LDVFRSLSPIRRGAKGQIVSSLPDGFQTEQHGVHLSITKSADHFGAGEARSFWKRESFRSGSSLGSSRALRPNVLEDKSGYDDSENDAHDTIADFVEIGFGCVALKHAEEESEGDLQTGIGNSLAACCNPRPNRTDAGNKDHQRCDTFQLRDKKQDGDQREGSTDEAADNSQRRFVDCGFHGLECDDSLSIRTGGSIVRLAKT